MKVYKKVMLMLGVISLLFAQSPSVLAGNSLHVTNIDVSIPQSSIVNQEIIYVAGVPVLFESYYDNGFLVDIASLLELTPNGYRVVRSDEEITRPMPRNFMDIVLSVHDQKRQININGVSPSPRWVNGGHWHGRNDSSSIMIGGVMIPGTRTEHWFDWRVETILIATYCWVGQGGMRASALQIAPVANITLTETITINRTALSFSFPPGVGGGLSPNIGTRMISASDVLFVATVRGSFENTWRVPTLWADLVTIQTVASSGARVGTGVQHGRPATVTAVMSSVGS